MLLTRETDYALRVLRGLLDGEKRSVGFLSQEEYIPQQFAYKIVKKLARAGLVEVARGVDGGCRLSADLRRVSLYDLTVAMDDEGKVFACMDPDVPCVWREKHCGCQVHYQMSQVQKKLDDELRAHSLLKILTGDET